MPYNIKKLYSMQYDQTITVLHIWGKTPLQHTHVDSAYDRDDLLNFWLHFEGYWVTLAKIIAVQFT